MIVGIEEIDAKTGNRESGRFAASGRAGNDEGPRGHLSADIAICTFVHVLGQIGPDTFTFAIGNTETLQLFRRRLGAFCSTLQMRIDLRRLELRLVSGRHYILSIVASVCVKGE